MSQEHDAMLAGLVRAIDKHSQGTGDFETSIDGLTFSDAENPLTP